MGDMPMFGYKLGPEPDPTRELGESELVACWRLDQLIDAAKPLADPLEDVIRLGALASTSVDLHQVCSVVRARGIVFACDLYLE